MKKPLQSFAFVCAKASVGVIFFKAEYWFMNFDL